VSRLNPKKALRIVLIVLGGILFIVLVGPFLVPIPPLQDVYPPEDLADPDSRFIVVEGVKVHYKTMGQGEPVFVLLHGFAASTYSWHKVMEPLARLGTVIAFDRPAFGLTERPLEWTGPNPYSAAFAVSLTVGLMDALDVERAILVGHSAGGTVALATALRHPDRVQALVLEDPAVYGGGGGGGFVRFLLRTPQVRRLGPLVARQVAVRGDDALRAAWHDPALFTEADRAGYRKPLQVENWDRALWEFVLAAEPLGLDSRLDAVRVPVLVLTGDDDQFVPAEQSIRLAGEIAGAQLVVVPACGHIPHEEKPDDFLRAVEGFVRR
jgi:pimeloyl-ACP methyl ester carboxylesterase